MVAGPQDLHHLHGQRHDDQLPSLPFRNRHTQVLLAATNDHVPHNVVDGVMVHSRSASDDVADLAPIVAEKLSGAGSRLTPRLRRKYAIKIAFVGSRPMTRVVCAL